MGSHSQDKIIVTSSALPLSLSLLWLWEKPFGEGHGTVN